ncbi:hypothetical protein HY439_03595 [Candidatus Microgenomates bacterium]|nr:hypothetical protein [Candidatus Microgenomates bacterium]
MSASKISIVASIGLFLGGIILLALRIPFWGFFLGLPAIQIGIILMILSFDRLSREEVEKEISEIHETPCSVCGKPIFVKGDKKGGICTDCAKKILE